jgi:uncharacterized protein (UPF0212 family)
MYWKRNKCYVLQVNVGNLSYPACKAHVKHCIVVSRLSGSTIFFTLSYKGQDFREKVIENNTVFYLKHFSFREELSEILS